MRALVGDVLKLLKEFRGFARLPLALEPDPVNGACLLYTSDAADE